jgi:hypothetical protein
MTRAKCSRNGGRAPWPLTHSIHRTIPTRQIVALEKIGTMRTVDFEKITSCCSGRLNKSFSVRRPCPVPCPGAALRPSARSTREEAMADRAQP